MTIEEREIKRQQLLTETAELRNEFINNLLRNIRDYHSDEDEEDEDYSDDEDEDGDDLAF